MEGLCGAGEQGLLHAVWRNDTGFGCRSSPTARALWSYRLVSRRAMPKPKGEAKMKNGRRVTRSGRGGHAGEAGAGGVVDGGEDGGGSGDQGGLADALGAVGAVRVAGLDQDRDLDGGMSPMVGIR